MLPLTLYALLHLKAVQQFAVGYLTEYLSDELGTEVSVGGVDIAVFRHIILTDVTVNDRTGEKLLYVKRMGLLINRLSVRKKILVIRELSFMTAVINTQKPEEGAPNYQFLLDYFLNSDKPNDQPSNWNVHVMSLRLGKARSHHHFLGDPIRINGEDRQALSIDGINLAIRDIQLVAGKLAFELDYLTLKESHGFKIDYLSASVALTDQGGGINDLRLRTASSNIHFDLRLDYEGPVANALTMGQLDYNLHLRPSTIDFSDIGHFFAAAQGIEEVVELSGRIFGNSKFVNASDLQLSGGQSTQFQGSMILEGLDNLADAEIALNVIQFQSSAADIAGFKVPNLLTAFAFDFEMPAFAYSFGQVFFSGDLNGSLSNMRASGELISEIGQLRGDVSLKASEDNNNHRYRAQLKAVAFDLGRLTDNPDLLGLVDMTLAIEGEGFDMDNLDMTLEGKLASVEIRSHQYQNLNLHGSFAERNLACSLFADELEIFLDLKGNVDFRDEVPEFDFRIIVDDANLTAMNLFQRDSLSSSVFSAEMTINAKARSLDELQGIIVLRDILYEEHLLAGSALKPTRYTTDSIYISSELLPQGNQHLSVRSDFVDADAYGMISFSGIGRAVRDYVQAFIPALEDGNQQRTDHRYGSYNGKERHINYAVRFKDTGMLSDLFFPAIRIAPHSWMYGVYNTVNQDVGFEAYSERIELAGRRLENFYLYGDEEEGQFIITTQSQKFMLSDSLFFEDVEFTATMADNSITLDLLWEKEDDLKQNSGHIQGNLNVLGPHFFDFVFLPSYAFINGNKWQFNIDHKVIIDHKRIDIHQLMAFHQDQFMRADGTLSADAGDRMTLSFAKFDVSFSELLMNTRSFEFGGLMNGYVSFTGLYQPPSIGAELYIDDFAFNHIVLGDLEVQSIWDAARSAFKVDAGITDYKDGSLYTPLLVNGFIYPDGENGNFDLDLVLHEKNIAVWGRYMESFAANFRGLASGNLRMDGHFSSPELSGNAFVAGGGLDIPYLNTSYSFDHTVDFAKGHFSFDAMMLNDSLGNSAMMTGKILHTVFKDFAFDLRLAPERMIVFNTIRRPGDYYYGTAFLTGLAHIHGPATDITLDVSARTNRGTSVMLPLNYSGEIRESQFITFVQRDLLPVDRQLVFPEMRGGLTLNFDLEITTDADVQMYFDTRHGDIIRGSGTGNLRLEVSPQAAFNIYGDFVIEDGEYVFSLQNIINKRFHIEQGSTVRWAGDLNDADVDLRAAYRLRTPMYDLLAGEGIDAIDADAFRRRIPVETILIMEDKLFNPMISFEIMIPGGDENTRELIERIITTEQEMNRQVFSLLVLNRFMPATTDQYNTALGYGVGSTSSELLSNQLSNWLSQISADFDIGVNYRPGDELSSQELELALSTQLFDDRVIIDGNFGVAGSETATGHSAQAASQIIGDVNIEVKITPEGKFRVKAFNRSNTFDIINTSSPYTQGIGLFYRKEFDDFRELFRRQRRPEEFSGLNNGQEPTAPSNVSFRDE